MPSGEKPALVRQVGGCAYLKCYASALPPATRVLAPERLSWWYRSGLDSSDSSSQERRRANPKRTSEEWRRLQPNTDKAFDEALMKHGWFGAFTKRLPFVT